MSIHNFNASGIFNISNWIFPSAFPKRKHNLRKFKRMWMYLLKAKKTILHLLFDYLYLFISVFCQIYHGLITRDKLLFMLFRNISIRPSLKIKFKNYSSQNREDSEIKYQIQRFLNFSRTHLWLLTLHLNSTMTLLKIV